MYHIYIANSLKLGITLWHEIPKWKIPYNSQKHSKYYRSPYSYKGLHVIHTSDLKNNILHLLNFMLHTLSNVPIQGKNQDMGNYRPISIPQNPGRMIEKIVHWHWNKQTTYLVTHIEQCDFRVTSVTLPKPCSEHDFSMHNNPNKIPLFKASDGIWGTVYQYIYYKTQEKWWRRFSTDTEMNKNIS